MKENRTNEDRETKQERGGIYGMIGASSKMDQREKERKQ